MQASNDSSTDQLAESAMKEFSPANIKDISPPGQSISQKRAELKNIQQDMDFFKGLNNVRANGKKGASGLPPGLRIGSSYKSRLDASGRGKLLRRYGGDRNSESAVDKALKYLASIQNKNGSWGTPASFKPGDAAALSS